MGFRKGDFVEEIDGRKFKGIKGFLEEVKKGGPKTFKLVRNQELMELTKKP